MQVAALDEKRARWNADVVRSVLAVAAMVVMTFGVGCDEASGPEGSTSSTATDLSGLQLTDNPPRSLAEACEKVSLRTELEVVCPPVAPVGSFTVQVLTPDPGEGDGSYYDVQGESGSLHRDGGDHENPGHWSFSGAAEMSTLEDSLTVNAQLSRDCERDESDLAPCHPERSTLDVDGAAVEQYLMPEYPVGGINGGHLVFAWQGLGAAYLLSVHDPSNRDRALAMLDGLLAATT